MYNKMDFDELIETHIILVVRLHHRYKYTNEVSHSLLGVHFGDN